MKKLLFVFDGAYAYSPKRFKAYKDHFPNIKNLSNSIKAEIDLEKQRVSYTPLLDMIFETEIPVTHSIYYYPQGSIKKAKETIKFIPLTNTSIDIIGYSWGGDAAIRFIRYLKVKNISVNKVYTLDPIRRGSMFLGFTKSIKGNLDYFKKETNVSKHFNIYQKTDKYSLPLIHLRGNKVLGADYNFNLSEKYLDASHVNLHLFDEVKGFLSL